MRYQLFFTTIKQAAATRIMAVGVLNDSIVTIEVPKVFGLRSTISQATIAAIAPNAHATASIAFGCSAISTMLYPVEALNVCKSTGQPKNMKPPIHRRPALLAMCFGFSFGEVGSRHETIIAWGWVSDKFFVPHYVISCAWLVSLNVMYIGTSAATCSFSSVIPLELSIISSAKATLVVLVSWFLVMVSNMSAGIPRFNARVILTLLSH